MEIHLNKRKKHAKETGTVGYLIAVDVATKEGATYTWVILVQKDQPVKIGDIEECAFSHFSSLLPSRTKAKQGR